MTSPEIGTDAEGYRSPTGHDAAQLVFLDLFQIEQRPRWTRSVSIYDVLPKFVHGSDQTARLREFVARKDTVRCEGMDLEVIRTPGSVVKSKGGEVKAFGRWPGEREELVMRALRYLAVQQNATMSYWTHPSPDKTPQIRVRFSNSHLQHLLSQWGHTFSTSELDEALRVLSTATLAVRTVSDGGKALYTGPMIGGYFSLDDDKSGLSARVVVLNPLETQSILTGAHRALNIERLMQLDDPLSRRLFELLVITHIGADKPPAELKGAAPRPHLFRLSVLIQEGVLDRTKATRKSMARVRKALDEMHQQGLLWALQPYQERQEMARTEGRSKIQDVVWSVWPASLVVGDIIAANKEAARGEEAKVLFRGSPEKVAKLRKHGQRELA